MKPKKIRLHEDIKIKRTQPLGGGYWIIITSDLSGSEGSTETAIMSRVLKVAKGEKFPYDFEVPRNFRDNKTGKFGWGYFIGPNTPEEKSNQYLNNLKFLVAEFNKQKQKEEDLQTAGLSLNQIEQLDTIVQTVEKASSITQNEEVKKNLDKYLQELENSIEDDSVFEFLIENFEKAKSFQKRNSGWKYSVLNALIVVIGDPTATYAGPSVYWETRNYQVKEDFKKKGIVIFKPKTGTGKSDIKDKVEYFKKHPEALEDFKKDMGIGREEEFSINDKKNVYQLAKYATEKRFVNKFRGGFEPTMVYTDNMVEPIPGKDPVEIDDLDYTITDKNFQENLIPLFDAVLKTAEKNSVKIFDSLQSDKTNVGNFSKILNAVALKLLHAKLGTPKKAEDMEYVKIQAEAISHIIKKHYNIGSDSSKYNIASWGGDKEKLTKANKTIMSTADYLINQIDYNLKNSAS